MTREIEYPLCMTKDSCRRYYGFPLVGGCVNFVHNVGQGFISVYLLIPASCTTAFLLCIPFSGRFKKGCSCVWCLFIWLNLGVFIILVVLVPFSCVNDKNLWKSTLSQFSIYFQKELLLAVRFQKIAILRLRGLYSDITKLWVKFWKQDLWFDVE